MRNRKIYKVTTFFLTINTIFGFLARIGLLNFLSQKSQRMLWFYFLGQILVWTDIIFQHGQVFISCSISSGPPFSFKWYPSRLVWSCSLVLVRNQRLEIFGYKGLPLSKPLPASARQIYCLMPEALQLRNTDGAKNLWNLLSYTLRSPSQ